MKNRYLKATWKGTDILIIDEVSMMSLKIFEMLDAIGKAVRKSQKPFGGIQMIFSGDFYQLPPVGNKDDPDTTSYNLIRAPRMPEDLKEAMDRMQII